VLGLAVYKGYASECFELAKGRIVVRLPPGQIGEALPKLLTADKVGFCTNANHPKALIQSRGNEYTGVTHSQNDNRRSWCLFLIHCVVFNPARLSRFTLSIGLLNFSLSVESVVAVFDPYHAARKKCRCLDDRRCLSKLEALCGYD
jgi:hypothetical protein